MEALGERLNLMVKTFRRERHRVSQSERTTVHGADSMLMVLQLAMADVNKKRGGEFQVSLSDVLMAWKHLLVEKLQLPPPSSARLENHDVILEAYNSFLKSSNTVDLVDVLATCQQLKVLDPEELVSPIQLCGFLSGNPELPEFPSTPSSKSRPCSSQVKMAVRRVFCSYLSLLINSKNDLALALTLNVPNRNLGQQAFTDIRHAARDNGTSLFLALTSFIRAIQLGGKGYAPAESNPLRRHVKGLLEYIQFMDSLEEILGEIPDPSACGARLVMAIRGALVKGRGSGEPVYAAAEETSKELTERIFQLHQIQKRPADENGTGISPARPKAYAVNHATAYGGRDTVKVLMALLDEEALTPPCRNKADLLCEDQPVLSGSEGTCILLLFRSPQVSTGGSPEPLRNRVQNRLNLLKPKARDRVVRSQFACTYKEEELPLSRVLDFPSLSQVSTCVHPTPKTKTAHDDRFSSNLKDGATVESSSTSLIQEPNTGQRASASLKQRTGAAQNEGTAPCGGKKTGVQMQRKSNKRKQLDHGQDNGSENEPPEKNRHIQVSAKGPGRNVSKASKKTKLLAGQGKLTSFFRV
ncbi:PCNA-interacting partner isoform X1 [Oryzias latipes]|uniref:PCNA-interacting partner n=1 Tax=Oryzias latipes TaxID=8090 RepID=A0A3B3HC71_ORYLA|nr:PCNA-interacting partner isoform X1 [Oryzias latipes]XP_020569829.1 PCNA-interacting partner isoform X1 [Oryzias latipes]